ncbi:MULTISPECIES: hypothetical protein [unclassified Nostoc]|uniref:hypothetical protein n=1 Tax=unclassified Nostoc TaxID=2593658 RepID=UPI002AD298D0|nr:hypothetical protein [Nostoc sp. DedQUE03]MDZ7971760.1 hypothetical protein [Nostoc sp. DedQUE03]MDZ8049058.1 hypothetical protein [Nostoc sp. DedQUE02]
MSNLYSWAKVMGLAISSAIAFSENSAIAQINLNNNLTAKYLSSDTAEGLQAKKSLLRSEDLNKSEVSDALENYNIEDNSLDLHNSIDSNTNEFNDAVGKQEIKDLAGIIQSKKLAGITCGIDYNTGQLVCKNNP